MHEKCTITMRYQLQSFLRFEIDSNRVRQRNIKHWAIVRQDHQGNFQATRLVCCQFLFYSQLKKDLNGLNSLLKTHKNERIFSKFEPNTTVFFSFWFVHQFCQRLGFESRIQSRFLKSTHSDRFYLSCLFVFTYRLLPGTLRDDLSIVPQLCGHDLDEYSLHFHQRTSNLRLSLRLYSDVFQQLRQWACGHNPALCRSMCPCIRILFAQFVSNCCWSQSKN